MAIRRTLCNPRFWRFLLVGGLMLAISSTALHLLVNRLGLDVRLANILLVLPSIGVRWTLFRTMRVIE